MKISMVTWETRTHFIHNHPTTLSSTNPAPSPPFPWVLQKLPGAKLARIARDTMAQTLTRRPAQSLLCSHPWSCQGEGSEKAGIGIRLHLPPTPVIPDLLLKVPPISCTDGGVEGAGGVLRWDLVSNLTITQRSHLCFHSTEGCNDSTICGSVTPSSKTFLLLFSHGGDGYL